MYEHMDKSNLAKFSKERKRFSYFFKRLLKHGESPCGETLVESGTLRGESPKGVKSGFVKESLPKGTLRHAP